MKRLVIILGVVVAAIIGSIYLLRNSATATTNSNSSAPLDPSVPVTPEEIAEAKTAASPKQTRQKNPAEDLARAFQLSEDEAHKEISSIIEDWGATDPQGAFNALTRAPEGELRHNALIHLAGIWAESNPQLVAEIFKAQTSGDEQERGMAQAITTWAKNDPMAALNWVNQNSPTVDSRSPLRERLYTAWASVEPEAATRHALTQNSSPYELDAALASWGHSDLAAAVAFQKKEFSSDQQNRARPPLLLAAGAQNSPLAEALLSEFLAANPTREEALRIGKALSSLQPKLAQTIADVLPPGPDTEALRNRIASFAPQNK